MHLNLEYVCMLVGMCEREQTAKEEEKNKSKGER